MLHGRVAMVPACQQIGSAQRLSASLSTADSDETEEEMHG